MLDKILPPTTRSGMWTVDELAALLKCSSRHVYRLEEQGKMPRAARLGQLVRWPQATIEAWLACGCPPVADANVEKDRK